MIVTACVTDVWWGILIPGDLTIVGHKILKNIRHLVKKIETRKSLLCYRIIVKNENGTEWLQHKSPPLLKMLTTTTNKTNTLD